MEPAASVASAGFLNASTPVRLIRTPRHDQTVRGQDMLTPVDCRKPSSKLHDMSELVTPTGQRPSGQLVDSWDRNIATPQVEAPVSAPALLRALWDDRIDLTVGALAADPEAAATPFFDHRFDPPLCCAVRIGNSIEIIRLLLGHAADANSVDVTGRTPLSLLCSRRQVPELPVARKVARCNSRDPYQALRPMEREHSFSIASVLLAGGASSDAMDANGCLPSDLAENTGNKHLASLLQHYLDMQSCAVLQRAWHRRHSAFSRLPCDVLHAVCAALVPNHELVLLRFRERTMT